MLQEDQKAPQPQLITIPQRDLSQVFRCFFLTGALPIWISSQSCISQVWLVRQSPGKWTPGCFGPRHYEQLCGYSPLALAFQLTQADGWTMWIYTWLCMLQRAGFQADRVKRAVSCQPRCVLNLSCFVMCPCGQCRQCQARVFLKWQQLLAALFSAFKLLSAKTRFALKGKPTIQALQYPSSVQVTCSWTHLCPLHTKESLLQREREREEGERLLCLSDTEF